MQHRVAIGVFNCVRFSKQLRTIVKCEFFCNREHFIAELYIMYTILTISCKSSCVLVALCLLQSQVVNISVVLHLLLLIQLAGDVELNPGPFSRADHDKSLSIFHLNVRSLRNKQKYLSEYLSEDLSEYFTH